MLAGPWTLASFALIERGAVHPPRAEVLVCCATCGRPGRQPKRRKHAPEL